MPDPGKQAKQEPNTDDEQRQGARPDDPQSREDGRPEPPRRVARFSERLTSGRGSSRPETDPRDRLPRRGKENA